MSLSRARLALTVTCGALALLGCTQPERESFNPAAVQGGPPESRGAQAEDGSLTVRPGVFDVAYRLDGSVSAGTSVGIDIPSGTHLEPSIASGSRAQTGQSLGELRAADSGDGATEGTVARSQRELVAARLRSVAAPVAGRATVSETSARVEKNGLEVVVPLKPLQELRYRGAAFTGQATVETVLGQRTSPCVAVWIETSDAQPEPAEGPAAAGASIRCRLAADIETAAGLPAVLALRSERLEGVLAVPLIYIGLDQTGENYVVSAQEGTTWVERQVVVGATDGVRRVVTSGLAPGDVIAPVAPP